MSVREQHYGASASQSGTVAGSHVLRQAYLLVGLSLIPTIFGIFLEASFGIYSGMMNGLTQMIGWRFVPVAGFFAIVYGLMFAIQRNNTNMMGIVFMFLFTFFIGLVLGEVIALVATRFSNGIQMISSAAGGTAAIFLGLAVVGGDAKRNFSSLAKFASILGLVVFGVMLLNIFFFQAGVVGILVSIGFIIFSSLAMLYSINNAVRGGETNYISLALTLYISLYNIFVSLLHLIMSFMGED